MMMRISTLHSTLLPAACRFNLGCAQGDDGTTDKSGRRKGRGFKEGGRRKKEGREAGSLRLTGLRWATASVRGRRTENSS